MNERMKGLRDFYGHLRVYLIVNTGLFLMNIISSPEHLWFFWPLIGWGIGVALGAARVFGGASGSAADDR